MPNLADHPSSAFAKIMYVGHSSAGKTSSLASLVAAGYKLRILDMDNGLDNLVAQIKHDCPDKLGNVEYETRRDNFKIVGTNLVIDGQAKAFPEAVKLLDKWSDGSVPKEWGPEYVFVLDSLTRFGDAAFEWAKMMNPTSKEPRQWYGTAQEGIEHVLSILTGDSFKTNVIVISHLTEGPEGTTKLFPSAIGKALGPTIPTYFNTLILAETSGSGDNVKRVIRTVPTFQVDLKNSAPFTLEKELPLASGMATVFAKLKTKDAATLSPQSTSTK